MILPDHTQGTLLDGRLHYAQPRHGYRTGIEPVLLAASIPAQPGDRVLEAGCGAAAALMCLLWRIPALAATGLEIDPAMATLARHNLQANAQSATIQTGDVTQAPLPQADHILANPPWHNPASTIPPDPARARATHGQALAPWITALAKALAPGGTLTLALPAAQAHPAAAFLAAQGLGQAALLLLVPKPGRPPKLALIQARHGPAHVSPSPSLILHMPDDRYTSEAEAILRQGTALPIAPPVTHALRPAALSPSHP